MSPDGSADKEPARIDEAAVLPVPVEIPSSAVYQGSPMGDTLIKSLNAMIRQLLITTAEAKKILVRSSMNRSQFCQLMSRSFSPNLRF